MKKKLFFTLGGLMICGLATAVLGDGVTGRIGLLLQGNPIASSPTSISTGQHLFVENCVSCHGASGDGNGELSDKLSTRPANFNALNRPPAVLAMRIQYGVGADMPAWKDTLDEESVWHIVNYLNTLAQNGRGRDTERWWKPGRN